MRDSYSVVEEVGMPIANYTTSIDASKSIHEIGECLVAHGAKAILNEYDDNGYIVAVSFKINVEGIDYGFRIPSDWRPVLVILENDRKVPRYMVKQEQALRVAWRILKDWVRAQMALVEIKMVKTEQVFLPYMIGNDGQTLYEKFKQSPQLLLGGGKQ